jgi:hypothetical protein
MGSGRKFSAPSQAELEAFPEPMILEKVFSAQVILDNFSKNGPMSVLCEKECKD